ncbi:hypothetical protein BJX61DRAFT_478783 [Aspergillus egyptiacus]|nr:hypothetical protein BJX61DRAFT_478783 [Aspergillus egyptiacus]
MSQNYIWDGTGDVLQGITSTQSHSDVPPDGFPSNSVPGDPASFLGYQFGTDSEALPRNNVNIFNAWRPLQQQSIASTPVPQQADSFHYSSARFMSNQDAWNPLQVTGMPTNVAFASRSTRKAYGLDGFDRRFSDSTPSESGSQYNGLRSFDSAHSTRSWTTRSIAASNSADSAWSPHTVPHDYEQDEKEPMADMGSAHPSEVMDIAEQEEPPSLPCIDMIKCDYPNCSWTGKCPSDKRKHDARHKKQFKCDIPKCPRKEGFGTINDLARHKKCVHKKEPERGPKVLYKCFGHGCPRRSKTWPRLDNFRQHLVRIHSGEDPDELLRRSHEWYVACGETQGLIPSLDENASEEATPSQMQHSAEPESLTSGLEPEILDQIPLIRTTIPASGLLTLDSITRLDEEMQVDHIPPQTTGQPPPQGLYFEPALDQKACTPCQLATSKRDKMDKMDKMISEAAVSVISAMTKMINSHQRRRSHPKEEDVPKQDELSERNREILQRILTTASGLLSGNVEPSNRDLRDNAVSGPAKAGWHLRDKKA